MPRFVSHCLAAACLFLVASVASATADDAPPNLLPNASFEQSADGKPDQWKTQTWGGEGTFQYASTGRTGSRSLAIASDDGADVSWTIQVPVEPHASYRLSGWIKTENVAGARGALLNVHDLQPVATDAVSGTRDWTRVQVVFDTAGNDSVQINCLFGGWGLATGKAWFDDVHLERVSLENWKPQVTIDAAKVGEPISKYIYGQFIEHLGRCIYGGIWAEMLEDRKFYFGVGAGESPWQPMDDASVTMVADDSFVGEHTPRLAAGRGMRQSGLGVIEGKAYEGYIYLKAAAEQTGPVQVSLIWRDGKRDDDLQTVTIPQVTAEYVKYPLRFTAGATTDEATLSIKCAGDCFVGTASLMPADNVHGMRRDTLALLKELDAPLYRWPGGNFVSGYDWRDGIGDRDRRPPRKNPAWKGVEHNDFGLDDFIIFCREINTEPLIVVNTGLGQVDMALAELQYTNGAADTPMGKLRAANGHPEPYAVKYWGLGNEMYGGWQLGHMPLADYIKKNNVFADKLREQDDSIELVAVGAVGKWSEGMMQHAADHMDLISEHFYRQHRPGLAAHVQQVPDAVRSIASAHRRYRQQFDSLKNKDIRIALDEWNYWYGPHVFGELGTRYFLKDALGIAAGLNEFTRNSDIYFMGNYAQTVNVIGAIKTNKTAAEFATTGLVLKLYRKQYGTLPLAVTGDPPLDVAAALTADRRTLTVAVVNPTMRQLDVQCDFDGLTLSGAGQRWQIAGDDPMAFNEPGVPRRVTIEHTQVDGIADKLSVAPCSVTLFALPLK